MSELVIKNSLIKKTNLKSPQYHASVFVYYDDKLVEQKSFGGSTPEAVGKKMDNFVKKMQNYTPPKPEPKGIQMMVEDDDLLF